MLFFLFFFFIYDWFNNFFFFFSSRRRHTRSYGDWSSDVCSSDLPRREFRPGAVQGARRAVRRGAVAGARDVLRAHSRLLEQVMLAGDLLPVAGCWLLAYYIRFYVAGPPSRHGIPFLQPYLLMLLPILVVWGIAFRAFGLYRPRRIGSRLSEMAGIGKASTVGALVLVS